MTINENLSLSDLIELAGYCKDCLRLDATIDDTDKIERLFDILEACELEIQNRINNLNL